MGFSLHLAIPDNCTNVSEQILCIIIQFIQAQISFNYYYICIPILTFNFFVE